MATMTTAAEGLFRAVHEGCIARCDSDIERRPYHRYCSCALHKTSPDKHCLHGIYKCKNVSYPMRKSWSEGCLASAVGSGCSSPSSSPVVVGRPQQLGPLSDDDENDNIITFNIKA